MRGKSQIVALSGGIGGAKLALGLSRVLPVGDMTVVANTGDDFEHLGLHVSPDIDTLLYTLAGMSSPDTGWGRTAETWSFMSALEEIGGETWFQLGDKDLALNVYRTHELQIGKTLSEVTAAVAKRFGISSQIIPMSDDFIRTIVDTDHGSLEFQDYFVRRKCQPVVNNIHFRGLENARPSPNFQLLLDSRDVAAFVICPSNPYLSIDPILAIPGVRQALISSNAPVIAVSPIVAENSLKGPTAKIMRELVQQCSAAKIAQHFHGLIDGFLLDTKDATLADEIERSDIAVESANVTMKTIEDREQLAEVVLRFARRLRCDEGRPH